jgi:hypothetical protein
LLFLNEEVCEMTIILIFGLAFLIPFLKSRYIWSISFIMTIFGIYQLYLIRMHGDGIGQAFAELLIWLILIGFVFGIITKTILSSLKKYAN